MKSSPRAGAWHTSAAVNSVFGRLAAVLQRHGGDVINYAGDAVVVLWKVADGVDPAAAPAQAWAAQVQAAALCAAELLALPPVTVAGRQLSVRAGRRLSPAPAAGRSNIPKPTAAWSLPLCSSLQPPRRAKPSRQLHVAVDVGPFAAMFLGGHSGGTSTCSRCAAAFYFFNFRPLSAPPTLRPAVLQNLSLAPALTCSPLTHSGILRLAGRQLHAQQAGSAAGRRRRGRSCALARRVGPPEGPGQRRGRAVGRPAEPSGVVLETAPASSAEEEREPERGSLDRQQSDAASNPDLCTWRRCHDPE